MRLDLVSTGDIWRDRNRTCGTVTEAELGFHIVLDV